MSRLIYADNAATTQLDFSAFEAMKSFFIDEYANASQQYAFARKPKKSLQEARETIAACIGALPEEIFFTAGGTESDNWAIKGSAALNTRKCATITSTFEHHAVLHSCAAIERSAYPVAYMSPSCDGYITAKILKEYITLYRNLEEDSDLLGTDPLFCNRFGERLTGDGLINAISKYNKNRGVTKTSIHLFRHTFAKDWILRGGDLFSLQKMLGHSSLDMVKNYANLYSRDIKDKAEEFSFLSNTKRTSGETIKMRK